MSIAGDRTCEFRALIDATKVDRRAARKPRAVSQVAAGLSSEILGKAHLILETILLVERAATKGAACDMTAFNGCLQQISALQDLSEALGALESKSSGWFSTSRKDSQLSTHIVAIIWYLGHRYSTVSKALEAARDRKRTEQEHLKRVQDKRLAALASIRSPTSSERAPFIEEKTKVEDFGQKYGLSADQMQMLQHEKQELFNELSGMQSQVNQTERSVAEIARLQAILQESLMYQESQIERIHDDADMALEMVKRGNVFLDKAGKSQSGFRKMMVGIILALTLIMLFMHFYLD